MTEPSAKKVKVTGESKTVVPQIKVHPDGPTFSRFSWGTWRLADGPDAVALAKPQSVVERIKACLALGITTFDLADIYGGFTNEKLFGAGLALQPELRSQMQIVTKCGIMFNCEQRPNVRCKHYDTSRGHILESVQNSLNNVGTTYLDLLLIHRPDPLMDAAEVASAFSQLKSEGKVRYFGVSNHTPAQLDLLQSYLDFPLITNQVEISVLETSTLLDGTLDQAQKLKMAPMAWSPFAGGRIFSGDGDVQSQRVQTALKKIGQELGEYSADQVALAWLLRHPSRIMPVLGSNKIPRIQSACKAFEISLSTEQWFEIYQASLGADVP